MGPNDHEEKDKEEEDEAAYENSGQALEADIEAIFNVSEEISNSEEE
jgi:hypothetical protein